MRDPENKASTVSISPISLSVRKLIEVLTQAALWIRLLFGASKNWLSTPSADNCQWCIWDCQRLFPTCDHGRIGGNRIIQPRWHLETNSSSFGQTTVEAFSLSVRYKNMTRKRRTWGRGQLCAPETHSWSRANSVSSLAVRTHSSLAIEEFGYRSLSYTVRNILILFDTFANWFLERVRLFLPCLPRRFHEINLREHRTQTIVLELM